MHVVKSVGALLVSGLLVTACGTASSRSDSSAKGDPRYVLDYVADFRAAGVGHAVEPARLSDALPNRELVAQTKRGEVRTDWSDVVLTGEVLSVEPGSAVVYVNPEPTSTANEEEVEEVDFDDPRAHSRNALVTLRPDWSSGEAVGEEVVFRIGVYEGTDPDTFLASLRGLQGRNVVTLLDRREDGRHRGDFYPVLGGALIGWVEKDGSLSFPGLGGARSAFLDEIRTVDDLREEAAKPVQELQLP